MSSTSLTPTATSTSTSTSLTTTATSPENERPHRKKEDWRVEKQAGTKTRSARRSSTCAAADDDPRGAPRRRPQPGGFGTASETNQRRKQRGKVEEWAARGGGGRGNGMKFETAAHYPRRLSRWELPILSMTCGSVGKLISRGSIGPGNRSTRGPSGAAPPPDQGTPGHRTQSIERLLFGRSFSLDSAHALFRF